MTDDPNIRRDVGGWISGPSIDVRTCCHCGCEVQRIALKWHATQYADVDGYCPESPNNLHKPKGM